MRNRPIRRAAARALLPAALFLAAAALVAALTWPWILHWRGGFLAYWDPPFHAWKLTLAARQILSGHLLPPDGNTNLYYPYSGAFFYEALHWPQAVFAAPIDTAALHEKIIFEFITALEPTVDKGIFVVRKARVFFRRKIFLEQLVNKR